MDAPPTPATTTPSPSQEPPLPAGPPPPLANEGPERPAAVRAEPAPTTEDGEGALEEKRSVYVLSALLGSVLAHSARYEFAEGERIMGAAGGGYELLLMVGSRKKSFALGGAASFVHAPKAAVVTRFDGEGDYEADANPGVFALTVGPAVDYRPTRAFHIGGLLGLAVERVPKFELEPEGKDTVAGVGMGLWLGFDWKASERLYPGVLLTGQVRQEAKRDIDGARDSNEDLEASLSLGLGFSLAYR